MRSGNLPVKVFGPEGSTTGLWLHGWLGNGGEGGRLSEQLAMRLICPDLPGHGDTPIADWNLKTLLPVLAEMAEGLDWVGGYSMGARLIMMSAQAYPEAFHRLVLESGFPGYAVPEDRKERLKLDQTRADRLREKGLEAFCREWYRLPMWGGMRPPLRTGDPEELAAALLRFSSGCQPDLHEWVRYTPHRILWLAGKRDTAYAERAEWVCRSTRHPVRILDAGHAVHIDSPKAWAQSITTFLNESQPQEQ